MSAPLDDDTGRGASWMEAARVGLASRLRNVLRQAPAGGGVIRLSVADGQALARLLLLS